MKIVEIIKGLLRFQEGNGNVLHDIAIHRLTDYDVIATSTDLGWASCAPPSSW